MIGAQSTGPLGALLVVGAADTVFMGALLAIAELLATPGTLPVSAGAEGAALEPNEPVEALALLPRAVTEPVAVGALEEPAGSPGAIASSLEHPTTKERTLPAANEPTQTLCLTIVTAMPGGKVSIPNSTLPATYRRGRIVHVPE